MEGETILYIGGFVLPDGNAAAHRVINNAKIFRELGYSVVFIGVSDNKDQLSNELESEFIEGFKVYTLNYPASIKSWITQLTSIKRILNIIKDIGISNINSIIAYNYPAISLKRLFNFCKLNNLKLYSDCTEWQVVNRKNKLISLLKNLDTSYRMRLVNNKLNGIIVISTFLLNYYSKKNNKILQLPPLVDLNDPKWSNIKVNQSNCRKLVYAGSYSDKNKDRLDSVLKALSTLKKRGNCEFNLTIIGITKDQYLEIFGKKSFPDNLYKEVIFKGRVPHLTAIDIVKSSDFSIFLRDSNIVNKAGFPTKFVESISCGTPVLTNQSSNIEDFLKEGINGFLLDTSSEDTLLKTLSNSISTSYDKIQIMKSNCKKSKMFDYRLYIDNVKKFIYS